MEFSGNDLSLDALKCFLRDQEKKLQSDKASLNKKESLKYRHSVSSHEGEFNSHNSIQPKTVSTHSAVPSDKNKDKSMVKGKSAGYVLVNSREKEKDKLINVLSVPKSRHSFPNEKLLKKLNPPLTHKIINFTIDPREKEKDRLAEIFASSGNKFLKISNHQSSKSLKKGVYFEEDQLDSNKTNCELSEADTSQRNQIVQDQKSNYKTENTPLKSEQTSANSNKKCDVPKILVTEYQEDFGHTNNEEITKPKDDTMVRIGEFSPLNPNHPVGRPILGVGEYDVRRKQLLDQRKQEYNEYLQQAQQLSRSQTPSQENSDHNHNMKTVATQTDWENEGACSAVMGRSPRHSNTPLFEDRDQRCTSPSSGHSPLPKCFEGLSEKEVKEYLYREELRKQIDEKNRLKEEKKRKEAEEEAKIEAKFLRDQEEMKKQFEEERFQRLELAIRRREQEDLLRQRLAAEQQRNLQECKAKRKQVIKEKSTSPNDTSSKRSMKIRQTDCRTMHLSQSMPTTCTSKALSDVHEVLKQPLLEIQSNQLPNETFKPTPPERVLPSSNTSALDQSANENKRTTKSPPIHKVKEVDMLVQRAVFDPNVNGSVSQQTQRETSPHSPTTSVREKMREVDNFLKQPLLPETFQVLPPMSPPLLHATIPPISPSFHSPVSPPLSPPVPASRRVQRTNCEILEDKWKVPYVERYNALPSDVTTKHNRSVLTQLGAFRRHLQQERIRMQQRIQDESP